MTTVTPDPLPPNPPNAAPGMGYSITALIVGIFAVIFCWVPGFGALLGLIAVAVGITGYRRNKSGQAIAGIILGGFAALIGIIVTITTTVVANDAAKHIGADNGNIISQWDGETQRMPLPGEPGDTQLPTIKAIDKFLAGVDGTYLIGRDIPAGTYTSPGPRGTGLCIWQRLRNATGEADGTISGDITHGSAAVTIAPTDYAVKVTGCNGWTKQ